MQHQSLFVFDIETIPDTDAMSNLTGSETRDVVTLREELEQYHLDITGGKNAFPRQPFHKVVAISFLEAEIHRDGQYEQYVLKDLRSGGRVEADEKELLKGFFKHVGEARPRLVSFNGRGFDLPVLKYRAMVHGISAPWLYMTGDKWNNYQQRYSLDWHCDLLEGLSDFGASARIKLNEICAVLGFPGKTGVDGSQVAPMYDEGRLSEIRDYCETDVLNTYLVYLRYMHHRGTLLPNFYDQAVEDVLSLLENSSDEKPHLKEFLEEWQKIVSLSSVSAA